MFVAITVVVVLLLIVIVALICYFKKRNDEKKVNKVEMLSARPKEAEPEVSPTVDYVTAALTDGDRTIKTPEVATPISTTTSKVNFYN